MSLVSSYFPALDVKPVGEAVSRQDGADMVPLGTILLGVHRTVKWKLIRFNGK